MNTTTSGLRFSAVALFAAAGCTTTTIAGDVDHVRELARIESLAPMPEAVDPVPEGAARDLLGEPLDAERAVRVALLNNRELRALLRELGIARGRLVQAGLLPNPNVEFEVEAEEERTLQLGLEWDITSAILAPMRSRAERPALEAARHRAAAQVVETGFSVRASFYALQAAEQRLAIAQQVLDSLAAGRDMARALFDAGNTREFELASHEAAFERARIVTTQLELEVIQARERVQRLLGLHGEDTAWTIAASLPDAPADAPSTERLETRALEASLELREARHRLEGLARRSDVTRLAGWLPDVSVGVRAARAHAEPGGEREVLVGGGVTMSLPLFDRRQGTAAAIDAELGALGERYFGMAIDVRSAAREVASRVESAHARARRYAEVLVPSQRRVTEQTVLHYNAMQLGIFQLLQVRRDQLDVELAYAETLREYWTAAAELEALLAGRRVASTTNELGTAMTAGSEGPGGH